MVALANMLTLQQRIAISITTFGTLILVVIIALIARRPLPQPPVAPVPARFDGAQAIEYTRVLAEDYPDRVTGGPGAERAATYIHAEFARLGYQVEDQRFAMWLEGQRMIGKNVIATLGEAGVSNVAVIAHYDGQRTSHQAAEDNASGVGVMLELARVLRDEPHSGGLIFVATDAEEWGMLGAAQLPGFLKSRHTVAAISIDYLEIGPSPGLALDCMGQSGGYTPLWLRQLVVESARAQGVAAVGPGPGWEFAERAVEVSSQDQGPLVAARIPALNLATLSPDWAATRARYHTPADVFGNFEPATFRMLGATVEQAVASIERLPAIPAQGMGDWAISSKHYLSASTLRWLMPLGIVPLLLGAVFAAWNFVHHPPARPLQAIVRPLAYVIPGILGLGTLYALTAANVLRRYELYPATPKDPFLYRLPWRVVWPLLLALLVGYGIARLLRQRIAEPALFSHRKQVLYLWLSADLVAAYLLNPFAAYLYFYLFTYGARQLHPGLNTRKRIINGVMLALGALPFVALIAYFGHLIFLGPRILWYLVLQTAYGVWSPPAAVVFLVAVTLWILFLQASVIRKFVPPPGMGRGGARPPMPPGGPAAAK